MGARNEEKWRVNGFFSKTLGIILRDYISQNPRNELKKKELFHGAQNLPYTNLEDRILLKLEQLGIFKA